ncbi:MAG: hypothetical protein HGA49_12300 [Eubacteriaceae bacterium]|nr:hypothetical protein [Eubacteriaceae bacterium]
MLREIKTKKLLQENLSSLVFAFNNTRVFHPANVSKFVFLCGANQSKNIISERRKALLEFASKKLPHTQFFLAEKVFNTLKNEEHKGNVLEIENLISAFSDYIIIILESRSAFAELGAFANKVLCGKLIIINDLKFKNEESFINEGPIKFIEEHSGADRVIYYKMNDDGVYSLDAIGDIYNEIYEFLKDPIKRVNTPVNLDACNPALCFNKDSAMFLHDLIYISGPVQHKELIEILILLFGKQNFNKVKHLLAILSSFGSVERSSSGLYRSKINDTYYKYNFDINKIISSFRNYMLKYYPERIYAYS